MNILDMLDDSRREPGSDFKNALDYTDSILAEAIRPQKDYDKDAGVKSLQDADKALADAASYLVTDGVKSIDSAKAALLVKAISDTRTILSAGDLMREDAAAPVEEGKDTDTGSGVSTGGSSSAAGKKEEAAVEAAAPVVTATAATEPKPAKPETTALESVKPEAAKIQPAGRNNNISDCQFTRTTDIRAHWAELERYVAWDTRVKAMDDEDQAHFIKIKKTVHGFSDIHELIQACTEYASKEELYPTEVVFLMLMFLSSAPERYLSKFVLSPMQYYVGIEGNRKYPLDGFLKYFETKRTL